MIICSLKHRDDERNDPGHIVAKFSGEEMIALNRKIAQSYRRGETARRAA